MSRKRPARTVNPDLRQQKHIPAPPIEEIEQEIFSLLFPGNFKPLKLYKNEEKKQFRDRILTLPVMMAIVVSLVYQQIPGLRELQRVLSRIGIVMGGTNGSKCPSSVKTIINSLLNSLFAPRNISSVIPLEWE